MKILVTETQYKRLFNESDDFSYELNNLKNLIESGQRENVALAFQFGEGMESYVPNFKFEVFIEKEYGDLLKLTDTDINVSELEYLFSSTDWNLSGFHLNSLPDSFGKLKNIKKLNLKRNYLWDLPDSFANLDNLETLNLSNNHFTELPPQLLRLKNLKNLLFMQSNFKKSMQDEIRKMLPNVKVQF